MGGPTLLLLEETPSLASGLATVLAQGGFEVVPTRATSEALRYVRSPRGLRLRLILVVSDEPVSGATKALMRDLEGPARRVPRLLVHGPRFRLTPGVQREFEAVPASGRSESLVARCRELAK
ncbi:MAG: hypothetical protein KGJ23_00510 [Euryarchaeota archaeon]|nr:hypothetical protein [Euryarchaeota archaeon]MDE1835078.1 hypothetical protein [Euryarchaeota archaeon]MDE1879349.1 hypothetical protein [Euryarchaeota archaeon]MDE2044960.1 hypothetical protein [Thermoplasmata archaeon]